LQIEGKRRPLLLHSKLRSLQRTKETKEHTQTLKMKCETYSSVTQQHSHPGARADWVYRLIASGFHQQHIPDMQDSVQAGEHGDPAITHKVKYPFPKDISR
jgi:hypothetical protein